MIIKDKKSISIMTIAVGVTCIVIIYIANFILN